MQLVKQKKSISFGRILMVVSVILGLILLFQLGKNVLSNNSQTNNVHNVTQSQSSVSGGNGNGLVLNNGAPIASNVSQNQSVDGSMGVFDRMVKQNETGTILFICIFAIVIIMQLISFVWHSFKDVNKHKADKHIAIRDELKEELDQIAILENLAKKAEGDRKQQYEESMKLATERICYLKREQANFDRKVIREASRS
jgi:uncharacterized membrane protein